MSKWIKQPQPGMHLARANDWKEDGDSLNNHIWFCIVLHTEDGLTGQFFDVAPAGDLIIKVFCGEQKRLVDIPFMEYLPLDKSKIAEVTHAD